jgi:rod shape-determining protein MreC
MGGFLPPAERRASALVGLYATLSLLLLLMGERIPVSGLRAVGAWIFAPFDHTVLLVDRMAAAWRDHRSLHERISRLEIENQRLRVAGVENERLRRVLDLPAPLGLELESVEVLALAGEPVPNSATVSAGTRHGIEVGDVAVTEDGLLGRVGEAYPTLSRVTLITDPNSAVACEIESTAVLGVLRFAAVPRPRLVLTGVPLSDTLAVGQRVLTSGMSRRFPRGIPVGRIAAIRKDLGGLTQDLEIAPAARLSRLRHAFVTPGPRDTLP